MDLSDFTEYQSNNGRNKCKSSSGAEYNSQFNTKDPFYTGLSSIHLDSAHSRLMRGCQMSRSWCWCPGNVWTSESEECLHSARVRAGAGIILRLGLRSTPALAVSRDPFTVELSQATSGQWSVNTDAIIILFDSQETEEKSVSSSVLFQEEGISFAAWRKLNDEKDLNIKCILGIFQWWRMKAMRHFNSLECIYLALAASIQFQQPIH